MHLVNNQTKDIGPAGCSNSLRFSPAQPRRAKARRSAGKAAVSEDRRCPARELFEREDRLEREADERVVIEAEQYYPSNSTGQYEGQGR